MSGLTNSVYGSLSQHIDYYIGCDSYAFSISICLGMLFGWPEFILRSSRKVICCYNNCNNIYAVAVFKCGQGRYQSTQSLHS